MRLVIVLFSFFILVWGPYFGVAYYNLREADALLSCTSAGSAVGRSDSVPAGRVTMVGQ
jgi:hypothetical protein